MRRTSATPRVSDGELKYRARIYQAAMSARTPPWGPVEIAEKAGLADHSQVSRIVRGEISGSIPFIRSIAKVLSIDLNVLLTPPAEAENREASEDSAPIIDTSGTLEDADTELTGASLGEAETATQA